MLTLVLAAALLGATRGRGQPDVACCGPAELLASAEEDALCWAPTDNSSRPLRLACAHRQPLELDYQQHDDGSLTVYSGDLQLSDLDPGSFCLGAPPAPPVPPTPAPVLIACYEPPVEPYIEETIVGGCIVISVVFFSLTAVVYAALQELRDLQGKSIVNFCGCFAVGLAILAGMRLAEYADMQLCAVRGFFAYFFIVCGFFWMNALSIQFLLSIRRPSTLSYGWREFVWYAVYAWGFSALLTCVMAGVNYWEGRHPKPGIGLNHCWFINARQQWLYLYSVMSLLCAANVAIFVYTAAALWRAPLASSHARALKYKFSMTLRLFVLMGLPWIFEMGKSISPSHIIWELLDLFNALQGLLVFVVLVVCRRRTLRALRARGLLPAAACAARLADRDDEEDEVLHTELPLYTVPAPASPHQ